MHMHLSDKVFVSFKSRSHITCAGLGWALSVLCSKIYINIYVYKMADDDDGSVLMLLTVTALTYF